MNAPLPVDRPPSHAEARWPSASQALVGLALGVLVFVGLWKFLLAAPAAAVIGVGTAAVVVFSSDVRTGLRAVIVSALVGLAVGVVTSYLF